MDRLDILAAFVAVADEGSFVAAARRLRRSQSAMTRAVGALEDRLATRLFNRTTRAVSLTDAGARYLDVARRALAEFEELELSAASERAEPRGLLTITAPEMFGRMHVLPIAQTFIEQHPAVEISMLFLDRIVSLVDEGIDLAVRIAHLPDSSLRAIHVGSVRRVVCASPEYLARRGAPQTPRDLAGHDTISVASSRAAGTGWSFRGPKGEISVPVKSRLTVSTIAAALEAAARGGGLVRVLSYQPVPFEAAGRLRRVLSGFEPSPIPIHIVHPAGRYLPPKLRLFIDLAVGILRERFGGEDGSQKGT
jgi:DNA-binding transcriptional LysR family regulator